MNSTASRIYEYIVGYYLARRISPSYREIAAALGIRSLSTVSRYLNELEQQELIERLPGVSRGILLPATGGDKAGVKCG